MSAVRVRAAARAARLLPIVLDTDDPGRLRAIAEDQAERVREATWRGEGIPVDAVEIARRLGLEVRRAVFDDDVKAVLEKAEASVATIVVDETDPRVRRAYRCAHMLGHYLLRAGPDDGAMSVEDRRRPADSSVHPRDEIFAELFGAALVLPTAAVRERFRSGCRTVEIARWFDVPVEQASARLVQLGMSDG